VTLFLRLEDALRIGVAATGAPVEVRDAGLLQSALARPAATVFGADAYPSLHEKAAALLHSIVTNHPLVDGNKRLGFACTAIFLRVNGAPLTPSEDAAYDLVIAVADGSLTDVAQIAARLAA
jgi:death on curing protein